MITKKNGKFFSADGKLGPYDSERECFDALVAAQVAAKVAEVQAAGRGLACIVYGLGETTTYNGVVTERKGNIGVRNLQRMPLTLYAQQWIDLIEFGPSIAAEIIRSADKLDWKSEQTKADTLARAKTIAGV